MNRDNMNKPNEIMEKMKMKEAAKKVELTLSKKLSKKKNSLKLAAVKSMRRTKSHYS